ncbi:MAG: 1-hydroxycarotenoid 3,4-desaturase CrtD [Bacteroidales bacterium]
MKASNITAFTIGSGLGGLAVAIRLARQGLKVKVFEKNPGPGGKINTIAKGGYRWDTGPSLLTLPELIEDLLADAPGHIRSMFSPVKLNKICRYYFPGGNTITAPSDPQDFCNELSALTGERKNTIQKYLQRVGELYELTAPVFIFGNFHRRSELFQPGNLKVLFKLHKLNPFSSMHGYNKRTFSHPDIVRLFDRYATYNGSSPYKAPATLNVIAHLEHNKGAYFPANGMFSITAALYEYARHLGVEFVFNSYVSEIILDGKKVKGLRAGGKEYLSGTVVSDCDVFHLYEHLLPDIKPPAGSRKKNLSSSAIIYYWGMDINPEELELHNIFFATDYKKEFDSLFRDKAMHNDPTVYVFISSKAVSHDAPAGKSNWFVMVNAPYDCGQDWEEIVSRTRSNIIAKLESRLGISLHNQIKEEFLVSPPDLEKNTLSTAGALYGNSSNSATAAFNRHPNFSKKIKGLYLTGGSVHPGGGIPLCLASAAIVEKEILGEYNTVKKQGL